MAETQPEELLSESHETIARPLGSLPTKRALDFRRVYGSIVTSSSNMFELSLIFGQAVTDDPKDLHIEQQVQVIMSWQAAKALAYLLSSTVQTYEQQVGGEIHLPHLRTQSTPPSDE